MHRLIVLFFLLLPAASWSAESANVLDRERLRSGVYGGPTVINGLLQVRSGTVGSDIRLDLLPAVGLGVELWPTESTGVYAAGAVGTKADITFPTDQIVSYNLHLFEAGGRYRWYFGPRSSAPSVFLGLGVRGRIQTAQETRPTVLLDRVVAGPELNLAFAWPIVSDRIWFRVAGRAGSPFFVRESPGDSGDARSTLAFGGRLEVAVRVISGWYVQLSADLYDEAIDFQGDGTRGGGVAGARTHDRFMVGGLHLRYAL